MSGVGGVCVRAGNGEDADCVVLFRDGNWFDDGCGNGRDYVCEQSP